MPRIVLKELDTDKAHTCRDTDAVIGRDPACGFPIEGPKSTVVSGHHARIFFQDSSWWIQDVSRNGTVLDDERLIKGERHALRVGQVVGLGDSGPRLHVIELESRMVAETVMERADQNAHAPAQDAAPIAARHPEPRRAGLRVEEPTEPMGPALDWIVHVTLLMQQTNQRYEARGEVVTLGRSGECLVQIPSELGASVSRVHAEIAIQDGGVMIRDAGSRNGTFVNGNQIGEPHPAKKGDRIMLGPDGPTLMLEGLRIVKDKQRSASSPRAPGASVGAASETPPYSAAQLAEPPTDPPREKRSVLSRAMAPANRMYRRSLSGPNRSLFFNEASDATSRRTRRRVRPIVWIGVVATVAVGALLVWLR